MRLVLLVYSKLNNWVFYMDKQNHLLRLVGSDGTTIPHACTRLTAEISEKNITIQFADVNQVFDHTKITFSGDYIIVWDT